MRTNQLIISMGSVNYAFTTGINISYNAVSKAQSTCLLVIKSISELSVATPVQSWTISKPPPSYDLCKFLESYWVSRSFLSADRP